jgi:hypothetical protein
MKKIILALALLASATSASFAQTHRAYAPGASRAVSAPVMEDATHGAGAAAER